MPLFECEKTVPVIQIAGFSVKLVLAHVVPLAQPVDQFGHERFTASFFGVLVKLNADLGGRRFFQVPKDAIFTALAIQLDRIPVINSNFVLKILNGVDLDLVPRNQASSLRIVILADSATPIHCVNAAPVIELGRVQIVNVHIVNISLKAFAQSVAKFKPPASHVQHRAARFQEQDVQGVLVEGLKHNQGDGGAICRRSIVSVTPDQASEGP